jgi:hypothetical protein
MTRQEQRIAELNVVRLFQYAGGIDSSACLEHVPIDRRSPDIQARSGANTIGIEVRRIYNDEQEDNGSIDRKREGVYRNIASACTELHSSLSENWTVVRISFFKNADVDLLARNKKQIAAKLVSLVKDLSLGIGEHFCLRSEDLWGPEWPEEVDLLHGMLLEGDGPPDWDYTAGFWVDETTDEIIQNALDDKENKIDSWRNWYDEAWLILVLDGSVGASTLNLHEQLANTEYRSSFDRVFIMNFNGRSYAEIRLHGPPTATNS